ncbi:MAG TPA: RraA family protein [Pseudolabrys sp.]|nr:RraA family protein [Pseudolabrys sp.]
MKKPLGKLSAGAIGTMELPPLPTEILNGFRALPDLTGMSSDAMDELGIVGVIPAAVLRPTDPKGRLVGRALTVRNVAARVGVAEAVQAGVSMLAEIEAHNLAEPGDILVLEGVDQVSNMGSISASIGHRQGELGAIVDGAVRDIDYSREIGYAIWSRGVSPITGKWRIETVAINKPVSICGIAVNPGDLVLADEVGVCFIPRGRAADVLARVQRIAANEEVRQKKIASGAPVADLLPKKL